MTIVNRRAFITVAAIAPFFGVAQAEPESEMIALYREYLAHEVKQDIEMTNSQVEVWIEKLWAIKDKMLKVDVKNSDEFAAKVDAFLHPDLGLTDEQIWILKADAKKILEMSI